MNEKADDQDITMIYQNERAKQISFPLGGIGTGCIGLAGNGSIIDWEIFNRPNKCGTNGFTHFAIKAERNNAVVDARVLVSDLRGSYSGDIPTDVFQGLGFGVPRYSMQGFPHFKDSSFLCEFPFASVQYNDEKFPGKVTLVAWNPFIPSNDIESSIPRALFTIIIEKRSEEELT
jgi:uncharacterized protein (DUF608 family)